MSQSAFPQLRLSSPGDLVEAVPYLLGFHPRHSLVVLALRGPRRRLVFTMRIDLPADGDDLPELADDIADRLARTRSERAVIVVFDETSEVSSGLPLADLVDAVDQSLHDRRIDLTDAVYAGPDRWWSYLCHNPACCPVDGTPIASVSASRVAAAATYAGLVALPSREALEQTLASVEAGAPGMRAGLRRAAEAVDVRGTDPQTRAESMALLTDAVDREPVLCDDAASRLIVGLADVGVRDACCEWAQTPRSDPARRLWTQLARRAVPPFDALPLCLLGWFAYLDGDATLAAMAVERCLRSDPEYGLALLLQEALNGAVDPALLRGTGAAQMRA